MLNVLEVFHLGIPAVFFVWVFFFLFSFQLKFNENWGTFCLHDNTLSFKDAHSYVKLYLKFVIITVLFFPYTTLHSVLTSLMTTNALS